MASPRVALSRWFAKASRALAPTSTHTAYYKGARHDNWAGDWNMGQLSASQVLRMDLTALVDRSRDLVMNNTTIARIPTLFAENVTGKDGIVYQAAVKFANENYNDRANKALEAAWYRWAENHRWVSADRRMSWLEVETMLDEVEATDGETFTRLLPGFDNPYRFAVQVLDTDQIDRRYNEDAGPNRNAIVMGVEIDRWGAPVAYHVWPNHPGEIGRRGERMRIPAEQIIHQYIAHRPGQVRGIPWIAPGIIEAVQLGEYTEAEVVAARVAAAKMGFIEPSDGDAVPEVKRDASGRIIAETWDATPGTIERIDGKFKEWNPLHPNGNYDAFEKAIVRRLATSMRVSYMSLSGDLSQTSYASGRLGYLAERMVYQTLHQRKIRRVHSVVHRAWLTQALLAGQIDYPSFDADTLSAAVWHPRSFPGIDVGKETDAADHKVSMGIDTLTRLAAEEGRDIEDIAKERRRELDIFAKYGVPVALMSVPKAATPADGAAPSAPARPADDPQDPQARLTLLEGAA